MMPDMVKDMMTDRMHGTTILCIRHRGEVVIAGDGQISLGQTVVKGSAKKVWRLAGGEVIAGIAGVTADALTLLDRLEGKLEQSGRVLRRAAINLAREWRTDRYLRRLEAVLAVADSNLSVMISGNGDIIEPEDNIIGIGSGGNYARAAALSLLRNTELDAEQIVKQSMQIAAEICVYTNETLTIEKLSSVGDKQAK